MTTYAEIRDQAMLDLVRDPRLVVYAADKALAAADVWLGVCQRRSEQLLNERNELQAENARLRTALLSTLRIHSGVLVNITDTVQKAAASVESALRREKGGGS